jgi:Protein of unknown function (DUF2442)
MKHEIYRVTSFEIAGPYCLRVAFDDGLSNEIDFRPVLAGELYGPLQDLELFEQVRVDPEVHTLVWPNGADFDPSTLHDWPDNIEAMQREAAKWKLVRAYSYRLLACLKPREHLFGLFDLVERDVADHGAECFGLVVAAKGF